MTTDEQYPIITGRAWGVEVCKALGLDPNRVGRIVLDIQVDGLIRAHVELLGDTRLLRLKMPDPSTIEIIRDEADA